MNNIKTSIASIALFALIVISGCADQRIIDEDSSPPLSHLYIGDNNDGLYQNAVGISTNEIAVTTINGELVWVTFQRVTCMGPLSRVTTSGKLINGCIYLDDPVDISGSGDGGSSRHLYLLNIDGCIVITGNRFVNLFTIEPDDLGELYVREPDNVIVIKWIMMHGEKRAKEAGHVLPDVTTGNYGELFDGK